jgi:hypothetical protein
MSAQKVVMGSGSPPITHATCGRWNARANVSAVSALLLALVLACVLPALPAAADAPAAEHLAAEYSPIAYLKTQTQPCDEKGEPFVPGPVETVLGNSAVALRHAEGIGLNEDPVDTYGPSAADLATQDSSAYLDLPGEPFSPGCDYEREYRAWMVGREPVAYARIATESGRSGLAVQYWLWYPFNDFNNRHEGDWEMIQLTFAASTASEALDQTPLSVAYAQHGGGETAPWGASKLRIEDGHLVIYPAAGSHATYFGSHLYLGWGEGGTGFGCDDTRGPSTRVPLKAILLPERINPNGPFAWLLFPGRWGQREPWEYNGPTGPQTKAQWDKPLSWADNLRDDSLALPNAPSLGPSPTGAFCALTAAGSRVLMFGIVHRTVVTIEIVAVLAVLFLLWRSVRGVLRPAFSLYRRDWRVFVPLGLFLVPLGLVSYLVGLLASVTPPVAWVLNWVNDDSSIRLAIALVAGGPLDIIVLLMVGPAIVRAVVASHSGRTPQIRDVSRPAPGELRSLVAALLRNLAVIMLLALSVVGLPWALWQSVRWGFLSQAVVVDGARSGDQALALSAASVARRWWQALGVTAAFALIAVAPGPLIGIFLLVVAGRSVELVNALGGILYALTIPFATIGLTLFYLQQNATAQGAQSGGLRVAQPDDSDNRGAARIRWVLRRVKIRALRRI